MISATVFDIHGRNVMRFSGTEEDLALNVPSGGAWVEGHHDRDLWLPLNAEAPEPRPALPAPASPQAAPGAYDLSALPAGTTIVVRDEEGEETTHDTSEALELPDAGTYEVRVEPPFPWLPAVFTIEVTP